MLLCCNCWILTKSSLFDMPRKLCGTLEQEINRPVSQSKQDADVPQWKCRVNCVGGMLEEGVSARNAKMADASSSHVDLPGRLEYYITCRDERRPKRNQWWLAFGRHVTLGPGLAPDCPELRELKSLRYMRHAKVKKRRETKTIRCIEIFIFLSLSIYIYIY